MLDAERRWREVAEKLYATNREIILWMKANAEKLPHSKELIAISSSLIDSGQEFRQLKSLAGLPDDPEE